MLSAKNCCILRVLKVLLINPPFGGKQNYENQKNIFSDIVGNVCRAIGVVGKYDGRERRLWIWNGDDGRLGNWLGKLLVFDNVSRRVGLGVRGRSSGSLAIQVNRQEVKTLLKQSGHYSLFGHGIDPKFILR